MLCQGTSLRSRQKSRLAAVSVSGSMHFLLYTVHVSDHIDYVFSEDPPGQLAQQKQHKEEVKYRHALDADYHTRIDKEVKYRHALDADYHARIDKEVEKYPHPLVVHRPHLYKPVTSHIDPAAVNVADSVMIGEKTETECINKLPEGFHDQISSPIKMMEILKKWVKVK